MTAPAQKIDVEGEKKMRKKFIAILMAAALFFVFCADVPCVAALKETKPFVYSEPTSAVKDCNVYAEPNLNSEIVGRLKGNPLASGGDEDVMIAQVRLFAPRDDFWVTGADEIWCRISKPVAGWVDYYDLWIASSGFFGEVLEEEDFFDVEGN